MIKSNLNAIYFKRLIDNLWKMYSISNLDDQDLMSPTPPRVTSTLNIEAKNKLNVTSPNVVPEQPSACKIIASRKCLFNNDDNLSESKIKLINENEKSEIDYSKNETLQQRTRLQPTQQQQQRATTYIGFRKEDLV